MDSRTTSEKVPSLSFTIYHSLCIFAMYQIDGSVVIFVPFLALTQHMYVYLFCTESMPFYLFCAHGHCCLCNNHIHCNYL